MLNNSCSEMHSGFMGFSLFCVYAPIIPCAADLKILFHHFGKALLIIGLVGWFQLVFAWESQAVSERLEVGRGSYRFNQRKKRGVTCVHLAGNCVDWAMQRFYRGFNLSGVARIMINVIEGFVSFETVSQIISCVLTTLCIVAAIVATIWVDHESQRPQPAIFLEYVRDKAEVLVVAKNYGTGIVKDLKIVAPNFDEIAGANLKDFYLYGDYFACAK